MIAYGFTAPAKVDIHYSLTLECSAFDLHKERAEVFVYILLGGVDFMWRVGFWWIGNFLVTLQSIFRTYGVQTRLCQC